MGQYPNEGEGGVPVPTLKCKKNIKKILVVGVPTFGEGEGGGASRLGQNPKFGRKFYLTAPFTRLSNGIRERLYLLHKRGIFPSFVVGERGRECEKAHGHGHVRRWSFFMTMGW